MPQTIGIFLEGDISAVVQIIFDFPMQADQVEQAGRPGFCRRQTGHTIDHFAADYSRPMLLDAPLKLKDLRRTWPIQETGKLLLLVRVRVSVRPWPLLIVVAV